MARKPIPSYEVTRRVIMNDEHRTREVQVSLPKINWMGSDYYAARQREPAPPPPEPEDGRKMRGAFRKSR